MNSWLHTAEDDPHLLLAFDSVYHGGDHRIGLSSRIDSLELESFVTSEQAQWADQHRDRFLHVAATSDEYGCPGSCKVGVRC